MPRYILLSVKMEVLCEVCKQVPSKYKCSNCYSPYCSVGCWKKHKNDNCKSEKPSAQNIQKDSSQTKYFTEDTVSEEKLQQLGQSKKLKKILENKYLQNTLIVLDNSTKPEEAIRMAMKDPEFVEFVDECLQIVEDSYD